MKYFVVFVFFGVCGLANCKPHDDDGKYTTKYDSVDLTQFFKNDRLLDSYLECVLGIRKQCSKDALELKKDLPEALQNNCAKCSDAQKEGSKKVIKHLVKNKRTWWNKLEKEFDPQGTYKARYAEEFKKDGITF